MQFQEFLDLVLPSKSEQIRLRECVCRGGSMIFCGSGKGKTTLQNKIRLEYPSVRVICVNECKDNHNAFVFDQLVDLKQWLVIDEHSFVKFFGGK